MEGSHFFTPLPGCLHTRRSILHSPHAVYTSDHPPKKWSEATVIRTWCYCPKPSCQSCLTQHICLVCLVRKLIYIKKQHKVLQKEHGSVNVKTKVPLMMSTSCEECQEGTANEEVWWGRGQHWPEGSPCWRLPPNGAKGAPPGARRNRKERHTLAGLWWHFLFNLHSVFIYKQITSLFTVHEHRDSTVFVM